MVITKFSAILCNMLNKINPKSEDDNIAIQYGVELLLDNAVKLLFLQIIGLFLGKGLETFIVLFSFCILRLQAGGVHAKTNIGCSLGMMMVWALSLLGSMLFKLQIPSVIAIYVISLFIIICLAPKGNNIKYFTNAVKMRKKLVSILIVTVFVVIAITNNNLRELLIFSVALEVLTLLPPNRTDVKGE